MRMKIIKRFSAATVGVCFTYALIRLPFSMINSESQTMSEQRQQHSPQHSRQLQLR